VPRHPQRFDEVARVIRDKGFDLVRRSSAEPAAGDQRSAVILGDTMGELRKFYSLADVVFVGRSLVDLGPRQHGSDMIEPAALAKPVVVGPFTHNFADAMSKLREADAIRIVPDGAALRAAVLDILSDPESAVRMGRRAQDVVRREQGATARHAEAILAALTAAVSKETT
jgi:3-deoxy-D-manno-octulosonic-acid transferase